MGGLGSLGRGVEVFQNGEKGKNGGNGKGQTSVSGMGVRAGHEARRGRPAEAGRPPKTKTDVRPRWTFGAYASAFSSSLSALDFFFP